MPLPEMGVLPAFRAARPTRDALMVTLCEAVVAHAGLDISWSGPCYDGLTYQPAGGGEDGMWLRREKAEAKR